MLLDEVVLLPLEVCRPDLEGRLPFLDGLESFRSAADLERLLRLDDGDLDLLREDDLTVLLCRLLLGLRLMLLFLAVDGAGDSCDNPLPLFPLCEKAPLLPKESLLALLLMTTKGSSASSFCSSAKGSKGSLIVF